MKYYSDSLKKLFDSVEELEEAEAAKEEELAAEKAKKEERKKEAEAVELAYKKANEAYVDANKLMQEFVEKYGSYHQTIKDSNIPVRSSLFDWLLDDNWFWNY